LRALLLMRVAGKKRGKGKTSGVPAPSVFQPMLPKEEKKKKTRRKRLTSGFKRVALITTKKEKGGKGKKGERGMVAAWFLYGYLPSL